MDSNPNTMPYEEDLALASVYLEKKTASVEQLNDLAGRLNAYTSVLSCGPDFVATFSRLKLQAVKLKGQARKIQASLLDDVQRAAHLRNDRRLAEALDSAPSSLSRIRAGYITIGATMIIRIHELTDWSIRDIKSRLNMPCLPSLVPLQQEEEPSE